MCIRDSLYDDTGERRWWIIPCDVPSKIDTEALTALRDAMWAQATADYFSGLETFLGDDDEADNTELNRNYTADNILEGPVNSFLAGHVGAEYIDPNELLEAVRDTGMTTQKNQMLIKDAMTRMGWSLRRGSAAEFGPNRPRKWFRT